MEINLFPDLIDALGKVGSGLKTLVNLPKSEREKYRQVLDETYRLIDTTLNMVILRTGDILLLDSDNDFITEVQKLGNYSDWYEAERKFRVCQSLRTTVRETEGLRNRLAGSLSMKDWEALLAQMHSILAAEREVADYIAGKFSDLANTARGTAHDPQQPITVRKQINAVREKLILERRRLLKQEVELYEVV